MQKSLQILYYFMIALTVLELIGCTWAISGFHFGEDAMLVETGLGGLKYFTTDSNILMGVVALINVIFIRQVLTGKRESLPAICNTLFLVGAVGVTLTMLVTVCFLAPRSGNPIRMFINSNFFLHLCNPLLTIFILTFLMRTKEIPWRFTFFGVLPMLIYAVCYCINALTHIENGQVARTYDWYGFLFAGANSAFIVVPIICLVTYGISLGLWALNRR